MKKIKIKGGPVEIGYFDNKTKQFTVKEIKPNNLTTYAADDIVGRLLSGYTNYTLKTCYFEFSNDTPPVVVPLPEEGWSYYASLTPPQDFIRSTSVSQGFLMGSTENHASNVLTLFAATQGSVGENGTNFNESSTVYGAALVASPSNQPEDDVIFARIYLDNPLPKLTGSEVGFKWTVQVMH